MLNLKEGFTQNLKQFCTLEYYYFKKNALRYKVAYIISALLLTISGSVLIIGLVDLCAKLLN